jgi:hypothetical protein
LKKSYNNHAILIREAFVMKKYSLLFVCLLVSTVLLSACTSVPNSPIKYERKLGKYFESEEKKAQVGTVDLSEGPKLRYDAKFGPQELNFDIKIVNPY